ncbi:MOSC domain-containing protein [Flavobacterium palustre]|nr:MOSC N-terminal beta barrel domain-containing protein [Flavobacterium palustre]
MLQLSEIWIYPVKSLGGIALKEAKVTVRGLENDRRWLLVDENGLFVTQREHPELALFQPEMDSEFLKITHKGKQSEALKVSVATDYPKLKSKIKVQIWEDEVEAYEVSDNANAWFSERLGFVAKLVYMPEENHRKVDPDYAVSADNETAFSDGFPFLLIGQSSLDDLNSRLAIPVPILRFRPNIVFTGGEAYEEETWKEFTIGSLVFYGVKPCGRCVMTTVDPENGNFAGKEPLHTLSQYRKVGKKVIFGQNVIAGQEGVLQIGNMLRIQKKNPVL